MGDVSKADGVSHRFFGMPNLLKRERERQGAVPKGPFLARRFWQRVFGALRSSKLPPNRCSGSQLRTRTTVLSCESRHQSCTSLKLGSSRRGRSISQKFLYFGNNVSYKYSSITRSYL